MCISVQKIDKDVISKTSSPKTQKISKFTSNLLQNVITSKNTYNYYLK